MLNMTSHQRNENLNHSETPFHNHQIIKINKIDNSKCWSGYRELELSYVADGNIKWYI